MRTRPLKAAALVGALALTLTGCMKMDMDLQLQPDDTIDGSMIVAIDSGMAEMMDLDPEAMAQELRDDLLSGDAPEGMTAEPYDDGDFIGSSMTFEGEPLDAFAEDDSLVISRDGDEFVVQGYIDLSQETGAEEIPGVTESMDVRVAITFPGEVTEHDGELEGSTVTWVPPAGERTEINARGGAEGGGLGVFSGTSFGIAGLLVLAGIGLAVLLVIALVIFFVVRSRRSGQPDVAPATAYGQTPGIHPGDSAPDVGEQTPPPPPAAQTDPPEDQRPS